MPNRILKESVCTSAEVDKLSWFEEVVWYRLIVNCDDYGRTDARPAILKSRLFPLKESVTQKSVVNAIERLAAVGLVELYEHDAMPYLQLATWGKHQRLRNSRGKYPAPPGATSCADSPQVAAKSGPNPIQSEPECESEEESGNAIAQDDDLAVFKEPLRAAVVDWLAYKAEKRQQYKPTGRKSLVREIVANAREHGDEAVIEVIRQSMSSNYQGIVWDRLKTKGAAAKKKASGWDFPQRTYTDDDLDGIILDSMKELGL